MANRDVNYDDRSVPQTSELESESANVAQPPPLPGEATRSEKGSEFGGTYVRPTTPPGPIAGTPDSEVDESELGHDENRDPLTGAPGAHPIGTGVGAATAGAAGAALGLFAGPVGGLVAGAIGAAVGAVAGGLAGKGIAEAVHPTAEDAYWREEHLNRPYYDQSFDFDSDYAAAYNYGYSAYDRYRGQHSRWEDVEAELASGWEQARGTSRLTWDRARLAAHDAWQRLERATGERDRDSL